MCGCYFDLIGVCDLFSTQESFRPCMCDDKKDCDFYVSENAVEKAVKKYAIKQAVDKALKNLTDKDGD